MRKWRRHIKRLLLVYGEERSRLKKGTAVILWLLGLGSIGSLTLIKSARAWVVANPASAALCIVVVFALTVLLVCYRLLERLEDLRKVTPSGKIFVAAWGPTPHVSLVVGQPERAVLYLEIGIIFSSRASDTRRAYVRSVDLLAGRKPVICEKTITRCGTSPDLLTDNRAEGVALPAYADTTVHLSQQYYFPNHPFLADFLLPDASPGLKRELVMLSSQGGRDEITGKTSTYVEGETYRVGPGLYHAFVVNMHCAKSVRHKRHPDYPKGFDLVMGLDIRGQEDEKIERLLIHLDPAT